MPGHSARAYETACHSHTCREAHVPSMVNTPHEHTMGTRSHVQRRAYFHEVMLQTRTCAASGHTFPQLLGCMAGFLMHFVGNLESTEELREELENHPICGQPPPVISVPAQAQRDV